MTTYTVDNYDEVRIQGAGLPGTNNEYLTGNGWKRPSRALLYSSSPATLPITTIDTPVKLTNNTNTSHKLLFTTTTGRLTYSGPLDRKFLITANVCGLSSTTTSLNVRLFIYKNGLTVSGNRMCGHFNSSTGSLALSLSVTTIMDLTPNDYIELWMSNKTNTDDLEIEVYNITISEA
jgi:hypothetical protein